MTTSTTNAGLRRITTQSREAFQARAMSPVKALRLSLARAADSLFDLALAVHDCAQERVDHAGLIAGLNEDDLLILLEGPERSRGVLALDSAALAGLVENQTIGKVLRGEHRARRATATDAALVAPLVDGCLAGLDGYLAAEAGCGWAAGYHCGEKAETLQWLGLTLDAQDFHRFTLAVDLAAGARQGRMILALPDRAAGAPPQPRDEADAQEPAGDPRLHEQVLGVEARLEAAICRLLMPLSALGGLKPGDRLSLPAGALEALRLEAAGALVAEKGRLGQVDGFRAVRLAGAAGAARDFQAHAATPPEAAPATAPVAPADAAPLAGRKPDVLSDLPETKGGDVAPGAPDDLSALPDLGDLPELSDLPDLADLPDLSDLSDLDQGDELASLAQPA